MRVTDPFPIPGRGGEPTHAIAWDAIARTIVRDRLRVERNERVILCADPYYGGAMLDALRCELQQDSDDARAEDEAIEGEARRQLRD
jgi:hypothetical protein